MTNVYLDPPVIADLKSLSDKTRVPMAAYLREAVEDLLGKRNARPSEMHDAIRSALYAAQPIIRRFEQRTTEKVWRDKSRKALAEISRASRALELDLHEEDEEE